MGGGASVVPVGRTSDPSRLCTSHWLPGLLGDGESRNREGEGKGRGSKGRQIKVLTDIDVVRWNDGTLDYFYGSSVALSLSWCKVRLDAAGLDVM